MLRERALTFILVLLGLICPFQLSAQKPASGVKTENIPEIPKKVIKQYALYQDFSPVKLIGWTGEGKLMLRGDIGNGTQVCILDTTSFSPKAITAFKEFPRSVKFGPKSNHGFTFRKDASWQYFFYDTHRKRTKALTRSNERVWGSCSGKDLFAFSSNRRNGKDYDIYTTTIDDPDTATMVYEGTGQWMPIAVSVDDKKILMANFPTFSFNHLYILDLESGKAEQITDPQKQKWYGYRATFSKDGKRIYYADDDYWVYDLATKSTSNLSAGGVGKVTSFAEAGDGSKLVYTTSSDEGGMLHIMDATGKEIKQVDLPRGSTAYKMVFDPKGLKIAVELRSAIAPDRIALYSIGKDYWAESTYRTTDISSKFVDARMIKYQTFDSKGGKPREIEAVYFEPNGEGPHPVLIDLHGGLNHQSTPDFNSFFQYITEL